MRARSIAVVLALFAIFALPSPSSNGPLTTTAAAASSLPRITFVAGPGGSITVTLQPGAQDATAADVARLEAKLDTLIARLN